MENGKEGILAEEAVIGEGSDGNECVGEMF